MFGLVLLLSACGDDGDEVDAGQPGADVPAATDDTREDTGDDTVDMISPMPGTIDRVEVIDDRTLAVHFRNGSEPCALAQATAVESEAEITVSLTVGLHPDVAAMSCVAGEFEYTVELGLDGPVGDREIVVEESS